MKCSICKTEITGYGHNPSPVTYTGRCCNKCNTEVVIPKRIKISAKIEEDQDDNYVEDGYECSECGNPVNQPHQYCSRSCFNSGNR